MPGNGGKELGQLKARPGQKPLHGLRGGKQVGSGKDTRVHLGCLEVEGQYVSDLI